MYKKGHFLSGIQTASFFSRLSQKEKKLSSEDYVAAEEEDRKENIKYFWNQITVKMFFSFNSFV